jgi:hypothetical protein
MLLDVSPLCLYHNVPMILAQEKRDPERILDPIYYWYACSVRGCNLRYDMGHGYHGVMDDELDDRSATNKKPCYECSHRLYMSKRGATQADTVWLCVNEECPSNERKKN